MSHGIKDLVPYIPLAEIYSLKYCLISFRLILPIVVAGSWPEVGICWRGGVHRLYLQKSSRLEVSPVRTLRCLNQEPGIDGRKREQGPVREFDLLLTLGASKEPHFIDETYWYQNLSSTGRGVGEAGADSAGQSLERGT